MRIGPLDIIFEDDEIIAINKPHGLLVHRSRIARNADEFAVQLLRDQVGCRVWPAHRLDRKTSGVLLFSKNETMNRHLQELFMGKEVRKTYLALVRGYLEDSGTIDYALENEGKVQDAVTHFETIERFEVPVPFGKFATSRYSLVRLRPETGRFHQLRKHMAHIFHPIVGDRPHGCNKQNRLWKDRFGMTTMLLHAESIVFPYNEDHLFQLNAPARDEFIDAVQILRNLLAEIEG